MLKIAFYSSLGVAILAVAGFFYFSSRAYVMTHPQWFSGFYETSALVVLFGALLLWWIFYFATTKDFASLWMPCLILSPFAIGALSSQLTRYNETQAHLAWLKQATDETYRSKSAGVSFDYVSEEEFLGKVDVSETHTEGGVSITLSAGAITELLRIAPNNLKLDFPAYLKATYEKEFPTCRFFKIPEEAALNIGFPPGAKVIGFDSDQDGGCPQLGPNSAHAGRDFFFELATHPDRVLFVSLASSSLRAYKPKPREKSAPSWLTTLRTF